MTREVGNVERSNKRSPEERGRNNNDSMLRIGKLSIGNERSMRKTNLVIVKIGLDGAIRTNDDGQKAYVTRRSP